MAIPSSGSNCSVNLIIASTDKSFLVFFSASLKNAVIEPDISKVMHISIGSLIPLVPSYFDFSNMPKNCSISPLRGFFTIQWEISKLFSKFVSLDCIWK